MVAVIWVVLFLLAVVWCLWFRRTPMYRAHRRIGVVSGQSGVGGVTGQSAVGNTPRWHGDRHVPPLLPELRPGAHALAAMVEAAQQAAGDERHGLTPCADARPVTGETHSHAAVRLTHLPMAVAATDRRIPLHEATRRPATSAPSGVGPLWGVSVFGPITLTRLDSRVPSPVHARPAEPPHAKHHKGDQEHDFECGHHVETPSPGGASNGTRVHGRLPCRSKRTLMPLSGSRTCR
jgi:hypothetical protein